MPNSTPVKNGLIAAVVQMMSAWFINTGVVGIAWPFLSGVSCTCLPCGSDVLVNVRFQIRRRGETGGYMTVSSACCFGSSISARSLPGMPTWSGSQQKLMSAWHKVGEYKKIFLLEGSVQSRSSSIWHVLLPWKWRCDLTWYLIWYIRSGRAGV